MPNLHEPNIQLLKPQGKDIKWLKPVSYCRLNIFSGRTRPTML